MGENYTYAVARIRALETRMLSLSQVSRMVEAVDLDRAFFVLNETAYADHISASIHPFKYEEIILAELLRTHNFLSGYAGGNNDLLTLWRKYDFGNAKILIRTSNLERKGAVDGISKFGNIGEEALAKFIVNNEGCLPVWIEKPIKAAVTAFMESENPAEVDVILDNAYVESLLKSGCQLLKKLGTVYKDLEYSIDIEGDNKTVSILKETKRKAFGIEPLMTFWMAKELEAKMIRQILIAKKHRLGTQMLKERIRSVYV